MARSFEFVWHASKSLSLAETQIFTHVIRDNYGTLVGKGFDWEDRHPNATRNPPITAKNVQERADALVAFLSNESTCCFRSPLLMMLYGEDFSHWTKYDYGNMSRLIQYVNLNPERYHVRLEWSTPARYFNALHKLNMTWPRKTDFDFEV
jgi:hypothetical protein